MARNGSSNKARLASARAKRKLGDHDSEDRPSRIILAHGLTTHLKPGHHTRQGVVR